MIESALSTEQQVASIWDLGGLRWKQLAKLVWTGMYQDDLLNRAYDGF